MNEGNHRRVRLKNFPGDFQNGRFKLDRRAFTLPLAEPQKQAGHVSRYRLSAGGVIGKERRKRTNGAHEEAIIDENPARQKTAGVSFEKCVG